MTIVVRSLLIALPRKRAVSEIRLLPPGTLINKVVAPETSSTRTLRAD